MLVHQSRTREYKDLVGPDYTNSSATDGPSRAAIGGSLKRVIDFCIASTALVLLLPTFAIIAVLIKLTSPGPIIYGHHRVGFMGKTFRCYKFRSMVSNSDAVLAEHLSRSPAAAFELAQSQKLRHDPRVTSIGRILRKSSLDELPQLFNIAMGHMSCVGPRPVTQLELERYGTYAREYLASRPGLTGLWQVSGRNLTSYSRRIALDRYYVRCWSPLLDLLIVLRTIPALLNTRQTS